jgi:hypothetical protein
MMLRPMECDPDSSPSLPEPAVRLRRLPYPYRAMFAICSDLDETPDRHLYRQILRFLNTTETTVMGPGVGLEVGNSIYFDMPPDQFAYWNTDEAGRDMIRAFIRSGHIDCLHSYGDLATTRGHAIRALDELTRHDCKLEVWVDHGTAATNLDSGIMHGHGDDPGHEAYHADLTTAYGVQYVWRGRVTSIIGQDVPPRAPGIFRWNHALASSRTLFKEMVKRTLAQAGNTKYAMHGPNETLRPVELRDRRPVYEFLRCNCHWGGVSSCDRGSDIGEVLTAGMLCRLIEREGTCILYTHLGKIDSPSIPFNDKTILAFQTLAEEFRAGRILVTTTRRLLGYRRAVREVTFESHGDAQGFSIHIHTPSPKTPTGGLSAKDLDGLTFYVSDPRATHVLIDGREAATVKCNAPDHTGRPSISLDWLRLKFPQI